MSLRKCQFYSTPSREETKEPENEEVEQKTWFDILKKNGFLHDD